ncbi:MAG: hypothetical protein HOP33_07610 [Verrucomicrobia bacterium]|nr:hypothetical protein [Verrucomicrobiota bacterium]
MNRFVLKALVVVTALVCVKGTLASSVLPLSTKELVNASAAVFRGVVVGVDCLRDGSDGQIYTRTSLRVIEPIKGTFPMIVSIVHRGGLIGNESDFQGNSPVFVHGGEYLVYVVRRSDGKLTCTQGSSNAVKLQRNVGVLIPTQQALLDELHSLANNGQTQEDNVTDQTGFVTSSLVSGLSVDVSGISSRFLQSDRGEAIPVLIDADSLPAGITLTQATNAVVQACNAWAAVTKLKFQIEDVQSFGAGADTIATSDEKLRIQLHDNYGRISSANVLGVGGRFSTWVVLPDTTIVRVGGSVGTNEFNKTTRGYVVLEHGATAMQNLATFTEVLCHEIGHALSMAHSSEDPSEPNNTLKQAIMYFQAHADGRGATLGSYDPPVIQQAYPSGNTPPYSYGRVMHVTTASPQPNVAGINSVELRGYDLQGTGLTVTTNFAQLNNGVFSLSGTTLKYTANGPFPDSSVIDPTDGSAYDSIYARFSDGTNASPYFSIRVLSFNRDHFPATSDGIPDNWMVTHFGNASPTVGLNHGASQDADGDKLSNLNEYRTGMTPTDPTSAQFITLIDKTNIQFQAKAYEFYELWGSTNLSSWFRAANPILPTSSTGVFTGFTSTAPYMFFRVEKVP